MLKALEIVGFKSFADRTRFDFPPGITVVVGPNGSGKSNVVDAIKWVLGEQSAKSLRGKDMSDVIFKGTGTTNGRRPSNTAEATLVLDNVDGRLEHDSAEIHVTRRVFRSGEGEYLINGNACRLKDIKDLFRGTGIGTDAYSLIEQGKVDRLLQASTKDRRAIFEEAAGISRFKAKKVEAQRRLARVDQNLLRLSDIVDEVGNRYRSVKAQASKAARYKDYSDRLRQLRIELAWLDWTASTRQLESLSDEFDSLTSQLAENEEKLKAGNDELSTYQQKINQFSDKLLELENEASRIREAISKLETTIESESRRCEELTQREDIVGQRVTELNQRLEQLQQERGATEAELVSARERLAKADSDLESLLRSEAADVETRSSSSEAEGRLADEQADLEKLWADQQRRSFEMETEVNSLTRTSENLQQKLDELTSQIQSIAIQLSEVDTAEKKLADETAAKDSALAEARESLAEIRSRHESESTKLQDQKAERNGFSERANVIEQLEKRLEGVQSGAKNVLKRAQQEPQGPFRHVHGLVADLIQVHVQHATLIDNILGEWSQFVVCDGPELKTWLADHEPDITGRVGFFCLNEIPRPSADYNIDLSGIAGVVGRADQVVTVGEKFQPLVDLLLGNAWIVQTIHDGLRLRSEKTSRVRYVTLSSEVLEPDGSIVMGPTAMELSLISRRSELRSLKLKLADLDREIKVTSDEVESLSQQAKTADQEVDRLLKEHTQVSQQLSGHQLKRGSLQEQLDKLNEDRESQSRELESVAKNKKLVSTQLEALCGKMKQDDEKLQQVVSRRSVLTDEIATIESRIKATHEQLNSAKVEQATEQKKIEGMEQAMRQLSDSLTESASLLNESREESESNSQRIEIAAAAIEAAKTELEKEALRRDELTNRIVEHSDERKAVVARRDELQDATSALTDRIQKDQSRVHKIELDVGQLKNSQVALSERLRDDYGLEVQELAQDKIEFVVEDRAAADDEVETLRRKITSIGAVNTDALIELEELEDRFNSLNDQFQDLVKAKDSLERIIIRINSDSRKIFIETLEAIRTNFQTLYRRNFGGGKADILLEEGVDELEAGIDIVATPPGKAEFSNSLLSGGEKALTAVSLLLAIFQFRPSPFCVLDEVDAPFDEANIGRFVEVLKGFLSWTRFVVVTHSKKTMTAADTLYGVTMLESGISNKVSVRFEDVDEQGNISKKAVERSSAGQVASSEGDGGKGVA